MEEGKGAGCTGKELGVCVLFLCEDGLEFFWQRRKGRKAEDIRTKDASGYGVGWVVGGGYVFEDGCYEGREEDGVCATDGHVDVGISASSFVHGTNSALIVRVNENVAVVNAHRFDYVSYKFNSHCFEPSNVTTGCLPVGG